MSVLFETSLGDIVIDLEVDVCPKTCENFLKLCKHCKVYYYNLNAFFKLFNGEFGWFFSSVGLREIDSNADRTFHKVFV